MKLSEIFSYLTYGELSNLKVGGKDDEGIYPKYSDEVVTYLTQGLTALHTRFALKHNEVVVQQDESVTEYLLKSEYAQSNTESTQPIKWIIDSEDNPFLEDIIKITEVYDELGAEVPLNIENAVWAIYTPQYNVVQIPEPNPTAAVAIIYRADHTPLNLYAKEPKDIEIDIPPQLIRPLCMYVASLAHTAIGSPEGMQTGFAKMQEFEAACVRHELEGSVHKEYWVNDRIWRNGWV